MSFSIPTSVFKLSALLPPKNEIAAMLLGSLEGKILVSHHFLEQLKFSLPNTFCSKSNKTLG